MRAQHDQTKFTAVPEWDTVPEPVENRRAAHLAARCNLIALPILVIFTLPTLLAAMVALTPAPPKSQWADDAKRLGVEPADLFWGEMTFRNTCAVCHAQDANGIPHLGKPLRNSAFVQSSTDDELFAQITQGRLPTDPRNTTGVPMPPRGGNATLTDERIHDVVCYLRTLQDPNAPTASLDAWKKPTAPAPMQVADMSSDPAPASSATSSTNATSTGASSAGTSGAVIPAPVPGSFDPAGRDAFVAACSACHGPDAMGLPNLGKPLRTSKFVASKTDAELLDFVKHGRPIWDPMNTTGVDMPPKGGNPALSDDQIKLIIAYIRAIHVDDASGASTEAAAH